MFEFTTTRFWSKRCASLAAFFIAALAAACFPHAIAEDKPDLFSPAPPATPDPKTERDPADATARPKSDPVPVPADKVDPDVNATVVELKKSDGAETRKSGEPRSFKELIELPDEQFDVAEAILALGAEKDFELSAPAADTLKRIDKLAERAKSQLPDNPDVTDYYDALYDVVLGRKPMESAHEEKAEDFDLSRAVFQRRGNCLSVGITALAVARRMGGPINGAQCPGHFFLRGTGTVKGKAREIALNFDVTRPTPDNWNKLDDDFYRKWRRFDSKAEAAGEYLRPMTDKQVVSAFLSSRSGYLARERKFDLSLSDAERALALNSKNIYALINAGYARESLKELDEAENNYKRALELDPQCIRALNNLAFVKIRDKHSASYDPKKAEKLIDQALKIDGDQAYLYATKGEIAAVRGDYKTATHNFQVALSLQPKNAAYRERFMALREHLRRETPEDEAPVEKSAGTGPKRDKNGNPGK